MTLCVTSSSCHGIQEVGADVPWFKRLASKGKSFLGSHLRSNLNVFSRIPERLVFTASVLSSLLCPKLGKNLKLLPTSKETFRNLLHETSSKEGKAEKGVPETVEKPKEPSPNRFSFTDFPGLFLRTRRKGGQDEYTQ